MADKFKCLRCGATFSEQDAGTYTEYYGEGVMRGPVHYMACPECGYDELAEAEECVVCGELEDRENEMIWVDGDYYCRKCAEKITEEFLWSWGLTERTKNALDVHDARIARLVEHGLKSFGGVKNG